MAIRHVVRALMAEYDWALPREDELVAWVLDSIGTEDPPAGLERATYSIALYEACRQTEDPDRREGAYEELFRFLYRAAYNRWPELAEDATQRALILVFEQIDRCQGPGTFLGFAFYKLLQAFKEEQRARGKEIAVDTIRPGSAESVQTTLGSRLDQEDCLRTLVDTITHLPDERQQKAILLKYFGGLSDEEIGARLQITAGYVRVLRHRGLAQLREESRLRDCLENIA